MQSVPITTNVASSPYVNVYSLRFTCCIPILAHARCTRYNIVIKVVSDLRQVSCFLRVLLFPPPLKLTAITLLKYYWILSLILKKYYTILNVSWVLSPFSIWTMNIHAKDSVNPTSIAITSATSLADTPWWICHAFMLSLFTNIRAGQTTK
jgi:hypothetical protein